MIIDLILDRKDGDTYDPKTFYNECMEYSAIFEGIADEITKAMDYGTEKDVQKALCDYIDGNGYSSEIKDYINKSLDYFFSKKWLTSEKLRKVTYYIDDLEFFKADMNLSTENFKEMFGEKESF